MQYAHERNLKLLGDDLQGDCLGDANLHRRVLQSLNGKKQAPSAQKTNRDRTRS